MFVGNFTHTKQFLFCSKNRTRARSAPSHVPVLPNSRTEKFVFDGVTWKQVDGNFEFVWTRNSKGSVRYLENEVSLRRRHLKTSGLLWNWRDVVKCDRFGDQWAVRRVRVVKWRWAVCISLYASFMLSSPPKTKFWRPQECLLYVFIVVGKPPFHTELWTSVLWQLAALYALILPLAEFGEHARKNGAQKWSNVKYTPF